MPVARERCPHRLRALGAGGALPSAAVKLLRPLQHCVLLALYLGAAVVPCPPVAAVEVDRVQASLAAERGIEWAETNSPRAVDYTNRITVRAGEVGMSGTTYPLISLADVGASVIQWRPIATKPRQTANAASVTMAPPGRRRSRSRGRRSCV